MSFFSQNICRIGADLARLTIMSRAFEKVYIEGRAASLPEG